MQCRGHNDFEFMFQLMTVGLLNTKGFQNLKYFIRSKGFLGHQEALFYLTILEISAFGVKLQHTNGVRQCSLQFFVVCVHRNLCVHTFLEMTNICATTHEEISAFLPDK